MGRKRRPGAEARNRLSLYRCRRGFSSMSRTKKALASYSKGDSIRSCHSPLFLLVHLPSMRSVSLLRMRPRVQLCGVPLCSVAYLGLILGVMTSLLLSGQARADVFGGSADLSLNQTAQVTAARFDFIIEGEVVEANPVTHASATGCIWVTELRLGHLREIKGTVADTYLLVTTLALPEELPVAPPGGCSHAIYYDTRPPQVGQRGIFLLDLHPEYGIFLQTVEYGFLPRQTTGLVTIHLRGSKTWSYEAFRSESSGLAGRLLGGGAAHPEALSRASRVRRA